MTTDYEYKAESAEAIKQTKIVCVLLLCLFTHQIQAQVTAVKGKVTSSEDKLPLIGATVKIKNTGNGVDTNPNMVQNP